METETGVYHDNHLTIPELTPCSILTIFFLMLESPGSVVPTSSDNQGAHQQHKSILWCSRLHQAIGAPTARYSALAEPPGLAVQEKRSQPGGGFRGSSAL